MLARARNSPSSTSWRTQTSRAARHEKRYQDVLELLDAGISVTTAVNIQHLETLNDIVSRVTGVRVRETVPDTFLDRADEVINVDVTVDELRSRLKQGKVYKPEKIEPALTNFFREGNLSTLRELALRAVADEVGEKAASYRQREGLEPGLIPERVMVCMSSSATRAARRPNRRPDRRAARGAMVCGLRRDAAGSRAADPRQPTATSSPGISSSRKRWAPPSSGSRPTARPTGSSPSPSARGSPTSSSARRRERRFEVLLKGSTLNRFLEEVKDAAVQVVPV